MYQKEKAIILIFFFLVIKNASIFVIKRVLIFVFFLRSFCLKMKSLMMYDE